MKEWSLLRDKKIDNQILLKKWIAYNINQHALPHDKEQGLDAMVAFNRANTAAEFYFLYSFGNAFEKAKLQDNYAGVPENYIVRRENFASFCHYGDQEIFGILMHKSIGQGVDLIRQGWKFDGLLLFFAFCRANISREQGQRDPSRFGNPRDATIHPITYCIEPYAELTPYFKEHLIGHNIRLTTQDNYQLFATLEGESIDHSALEIGPNVIIRHANPTSAKKILSKIKVIFDNALDNPDISGAKAYETAGLIFRWICQAKPWERGDPSIAEMLVRSFLSFKNIDPGPWKQDLIPWSKVMEEYNPQEFSKNFKTLFASS